MGERPGEGPVGRAILLRNAVAAVAALVIVFAAFLLRVYRLDAVGLDGDEAFAIETASKGFAQIAQLVATAEPHPPLYYSALRLWHLLAGSSEFALRYPSLAADVLAVGALTRLAGRFSWRAAGLFGAALFALNPYQVWYSQEARMYAPLALFGLLAVDAAVRSLSVGTLRQLGLYALFMLLALYTHYYAIFLFGLTAAVGLVATWRCRPVSPSPARWFAAQAVVAALFLAWLVVASRIALSYAPYAAGSVDLAAILEESLVRHSLGLAVPFDFGLKLSLGFVVVAVAGLWLAGRDGDRAPAWLRWAIVAGYLLVPVALGVLVSLLRPMLAARYLMVSAPAFFLALGLGVAGLYRRAAVVGVAAGLLLVSAEGYALWGYFSDAKYAKSDFREAAAYIAAHARPGDAVVLDGWSQKFQFWYYLARRAGDPMPGYLFPPEGGEGWEAGRRQLDRIMAGHTGVWLLDYDVLAYDPERVVETQLAQGYYQVLTHRIGQNRVVYYASAPLSVEGAGGLDVTCNQEIQLDGFSRGAGSPRPGDVLPLALRWRALKPIGREYVVSWRLLDGAGHRILQRDAPPASGFAPTRSWTVGQEVVDRFGMALPSWLAPGRYVLGMLVYDQATGGQCQAEQGGRVLPGGLIPLGSVDVADGAPAPDLEEARPSRSTGLAFGRLRLLGFDLGDGPVQPGETVPLKLYWQARDDGGRDEQVAVRLTAADGATAREQWENLGPPQFPTSRWTRGRTVVTYVDLPVPGSFASGTYGLWLTVGLPGESDFVPLASVSVVGRARRFDVPAVAYPTAVDFGRQIELLGFDEEPGPGGTIGAGQTIHLTLYWRALTEMTTSYKVFTQLLGPDGKIYGQHDAVPLGGQAPTSGWAPGEVLADRYTLVVRPEAPAGQYEIIVGFYEPDTGKRIPLADRPEDHFVVASLTSK